MTRTRGAKARRQQRAQCPRPDKKPYDQELYAFQRWSKLPESQKATNQVYRCRCGKYHLGRPKGKAYEQIQGLPRSEPIDPE